MTNRITHQHDSRNYSFQRKKYVNTLFEYRKYTKKTVFIPIVLRQWEAVQCPGEVRRWVSRGDAFEGNRRSWLYRLLDELEDQLRRGVCDDEKINKKF